MKSIGGRPRSGAPAVDLMSDKPAPAAQSGEPTVRMMEGEQNVYASVYYVLLFGMSLSSILFTVGIVLALLHPHYIPLTTSWIRGHYHWATVVRGLATFNPTIILMAATVLLILTPVVRVLASIYAFWVDHDTKYVVVTGIVFLVIVLTLILGRLGLR